MKHMTRDEERVRHSRSVQVAVGLECKLTGLIRESLAGNKDALVDFQQFIQYAPQPMRERVAVRLRNGGKW